MILYEQSATPSTRAGEFDVAGRRVAVRGFPYAGEVGPPAYRFDPVARRFFARRQDGTILAGPGAVEPWQAAFARGPAGPALIGPAGGGEDIWGAYLAAAQGAREAGRAVYLLDPPPAGLPPDAAGEFTALFVWIPGRENPPSLSAAISRGIAAGYVLPLLPGWTEARDAVGEAVRRAAAAGGNFLAGILPSEEGDARRSIVEAAGALGGGAGEDLFERVHHEDFGQPLGAALEALAEDCSRQGLSAVLPRPAGRGEPRGNAAVAGRLEERAQDSWKDEHRAALLRAAARWIEESGRDLVPIVREGNLRKVFPFGADLAEEVEQAFGVSIVR